MKKFTAFFLLYFTLIFSQSGNSQDFASYYSRNLFLMAPAGSFRQGLGGFANPATTRMTRTFNTQFYWTGNAAENTSINDWGLYSAFRGFGFSVQQQKSSGAKVTDYNFNLAFGDYSSSVGIGYTWSSGDQAAFSREKMFSLGLLLRPNRFLSLGGVGSISTQSSAKEGVLEAAVRPLGTPFLTIFGDWAIQKTQRLKDAPWSAGAAVQLFNGFKLVGRYFDNDFFTFGLSVNLGSTAFSGQSHYNSDEKRTFNSYGIRLGEYQPTFMSSFGKNRYYYPLELKGRVAYHKFLLFDENTHRFMDIIQNIRAAAKDPRVEVIAINLSSVKVLPEHAWEIRSELKKAQKAGKKVVAYIDYAGMTEYHLASVADMVFMDPEGLLFMEGYLMGRTFLRGTLDKLGLGIDEWRFFKYKSAAEALSRKNFSEADREQRQAYVDDVYNLAKNEISSGRNFDSEKFDEIINQKVALVPRDALAEGLVDTLCRWSSVKDVIKSLTGKKKRKMGKDRLHSLAEAHGDWSELLSIAVVYGLGVCAMDNGINARKLEKVFHKLAKDDNVKAVVFRVDSPGGDGMASDVVATALRKCAKKKPVIISQGQVAGSGGYWISMYGDTIVAGPNTITGSIGVIGLWIYDKGFSGKLGMSADFVKRGDHADLGFGVRLPFLGLQIPARNLTDEERGKMEVLIKRFYKDFVGKVADGRGMETAAVDSIAQGRFYSGVEGQKIGLVDEIGGLGDAIDIARAAAKIPAGRKINIREIPKSRGLFGFEWMTRLSVKNEIKQDPVIEFIRMVVERPAYPWHMMEPGTYPLPEK